MLNRLGGLPFKTVLYCVAGLFWLVHVDAKVVRGQGLDEHRADAEQTQELLRKLDWGTLQFDVKTSLMHLMVTGGVEKLSLPTPSPHITRGYVGTPHWPGSTVGFSFNSDATNIAIDASNLGASRPMPVTLETAEASQQFADGRIVFSAADASVHGNTAKLESHPGNHRIGFWVDASDFVSWKYQATRPGNYSIWLTYSCAGKANEKASSIEISVGDITLPLSLTRTGNWYDYATISAGALRIAAAEEIEIQVKCREQIGGAVMNLKAVTLVPASEGVAVVQPENGSIRLHAQDATIWGNLLQWEPKPEKQTLGYWANPQDFATWEFEVLHEDVFELEILQGCGAGQGGSQVAFEFFAENQSQPLAVFEHRVLDTGHWQAFIPCKIGKVELGPGRYLMKARAVKKAGVAVMDLRQCTLTPSILFPEKK